jgi:hypothetical protein
MLFLIVDFYNSDAICSRLISDQLNKGVHMMQHSRMALPYPVPKELIPFLTAQLLDMYAINILGLGKMPTPRRNGT